MIRDVIKLMMYDEVFPPDGFGPRQWLRPEELILSGYSNTDPITVWVDHSAYMTDADGDYVDSGGVGTPPITTPPTFDDVDTLNDWPVAKLITAGQFTGPIFWGQFFDLNIGSGGWAAQEMLIVVKSNTSGDVVQDGGRGAWTFNADGLTTNSTYNLASAIQEAFGTTSNKNVGNPGFALNGWRIYQVYSATNNWKAFIDGTEIFSTSTNTVSPAAWELGLSHNGGVLPTYLRGNIVEYIFWDKKLTAEQRLLALGYAQDKYNLSTPPPITGGLTDNFNNAGLWQIDGATVTPTSTELTISGTTTAHLRTVSSYNMTSKAVAVHLQDVPVASANYGQQLVVGTGDSFADCYVAYLQDGTLSFIRGVASAYTTVFSLAFDANTCSYMRIRFDSGIVYFDTSGNGVTWANRASETAAITLTALYAYLRTVNAGTSVTQKWNNFVSNL